MGRLYAVVFVLMLLVVVYFVSSFSAYATDVTSLTTSTSSTDSTPAMPTVMKINSEQNISSDSMEGYALPYPGILPDHPLYPLKRIRDQILEYLIRNPQDKINFYILMADKHMSMGQSLVDKGNNALAYQTMKQAQTYFGKAIDSTSSARTASRVINPDIKDRLMQSNKKHEAMVVVIIEKSPEKSSAINTDLLPTIQQLQKKVESIAL